MMLKENIKTISKKTSKEYNMSAIQKYNDFIKTNPTGKRAIDKAINLCIFAIGEAKNKKDSTELSKLNSQYRQLTKMKGKA